MNKSRTTPSKVEWTAEGLNVLLPIYKDIEELQATKRSSETCFIHGTMEDVQKVSDYIVEKLADQELISEREWEASFWYQGGAHAAGNKVAQKKTIEQTGASLQGCYKIVH